MKYKSEYTYIDYCSIRPDRLTFFGMSDRPRHRSLAQIANEKYLSMNEKNDKFSWKSKKRVNNALSWLLELSKNERYYSQKHLKYYNLRVNFITLTLSSKQVHSDNEIKSKLLNQFFTEIRQKYGVKHYVWCAESQGNGNIHFHVTTNKYIYWKDIRKTWNRIQDKLGYSSRFFDKFGHHDPNSIDVHAVRNVKNLPAYLYKYFTKEDNAERPICAGAKDNRGIQGRRWGLSTSLSRIKSCLVENYGELNKELGFIYKKFEDKVKEFDFARVIYLPFNYIRKIGLNMLIKEFDEYKEKMSNPPPLKLVPC